MVVWLITLDVARYVEIHTERKKNRPVNHQSAKRFGPRKGQTKCWPDLDPDLDLNGSQW